MVQKSKNNLLVIVAGNYADDSVCSTADYCGG